jgi:hypothetical protein
MTSSPMTTRRIRFGKFLLAGGLLAGAALFPIQMAQATSDKVTICHAAGQDGTTKFVTLKISENAVYKENGGHFFENGTPRAGHEDDYFGACTTDVTTTTTVGSTTTVSDDPTTTTTTVASTTTTTLVEETTTTTLPDESTTTTTESDGSTTTTVPETDIGDPVTLHRHGGAVPVPAAVTYTG